MYKILPTLLLGLLAAVFAFPQARDAAAQDAPAAAAQSGPAAGPAANSASTVEENVVYGIVNGSELRLDVYKPDAPKSESGKPQNRAAVVLIHGGGWTSFDKSTMQRMGQFLARSGFVAFAVDYRLLKGTENRWPAQLDDVQRAVRWVRANAARYDVDPARIGAFGHSAGAQLAALLGMVEARDNSDPTLAKYSSRVQAVVDASGPTDFTTHSDPEDVAFLSNFLGADFSKHPEVWRGASPAFQVSKENAPFLIVHGTKDESVPIAQAQELFDKLQSAGVPVSFIKIDDGHTFVTPEARRQLAMETLAFFNRYLLSTK